MKHLWSHAYEFNNHFDSPLWEFVEDPKNEEIIGGLIEKRLEPSINANSINDGDKEELIFQNILSIRHWFPMVKKGNECYISGMHLIINRLMDSIIEKMKGYDLDDEVFVRIMMWAMTHEYYTTWSEWRYLWDIIHEEQVIHKKKGKMPFDYPVCELWTKFITFNTEVVTDTYREGKLRLEAFVNELITNGSPLNLTKEVLQYAQDVCIDNEVLLKFSDEAIEEVNILYPDYPDIIKWFEQFRIKRWMEFKPYLLLTAIVASTYNDEELFLFFDPYSFDMWICDRKNLNVMNTNPVIVFNFTNIVSSIFCGHCMEKRFEEYNLDTVSNKERIEAIKKMFNETLTLILWVCPDELTLRIEGKVDDNDQLLTVRRKLPFAKVGYDQYGAQNKWVFFMLEKQLKGFLKRLLK